MNSRKAAKTVGTTISRLLKSNSFLKSPPPSFYPLLAFPPSPSLVSSSPARPSSDLPLPKTPPTPYFLAKQKLDSGLSLKPSEEAALASPSSERSRTRRAPPVPRGGKGRKRVREIVWSEDLIRKRFFKDHPFEAYRPVYLSESEFVEEERGPKGKEWTSLEQRTRIPTAEDCIAFTTHLHTVFSLPLSLAYSTSISQFRTLRAEHETATRAAVLESQAHGAQYTTYVQLGNAVQDSVLDQWGGDNARDVQKAFAAERPGAPLSAGASAGGRTSIWDTVSMRGDRGEVEEVREEMEEFSGGYEYTKRFEERRGSSEA